MEDARKKDILDAAIEIIAKEGYTHAKVFHISDKARVASGLIYSPKFFKNKLDLLLSIVLHFWETLNEQIENRVARLESPIEKIGEIIAILEELLIKDKHSIYLSKVLHESLPHYYFIKVDELIDKRRKITDENRKLLNTIDKIIEEGQERGEFDHTLKAPVMRQVLYGSFEFLLYGLFLRISRGDSVGYGKEDIAKVMDKLIRKFLAE